MARQRDVSDSEPSIVSEPEFLRKTHLTLGRACRREDRRADVIYIYSLKLVVLASQVPESAMLWRMNFTGFGRPGRR
jgi:hypothetical protein